MSVLKQNKCFERRKMRVRNHVKRGGHRVSVTRSLKHMHAQLIDDATHKTLASCSSLQLDIVGDKKAVARAVGLELARKAKELGVVRAVFDRGPFLYHGRVAQVAEGLREGGLSI